MSKKIDEIKDIVNEYVQQEKIALFVGAGISALSGYPSWSKLVLNMAKKIGYQVKLKDLDGNECLSSDEYLKIPQIFYENKGEKEYFKIVRKQLHIIKEPNEIHKMIMHLHPNHILTTNYDTLLEQTANRIGMSYSVINSDSKVSVAPTRNYILKVHGDFENNNFVLKEKDYLDYETNFKLVDNLMKTIISTHLVIFIGYSLGDYNIKLVLNWVKHVQKDSFIEPIFIHTDTKELTEMEEAYYRGEGLKVLDVNKLLDSPKTSSYKERYVKALTILLDADKPDKWYRNETWIVDYFYKKIESLTDVNYLRIEDVANIFKGSQIFYYNTLKSPDFTYLFQAYIKRDRLSKKRGEQLQTVLNRLKQSGVEAICDAEGNVNQDINMQIKRGLIIENDTFDVSYQEICKRINRYDDSIESQYCKAYDLFWVGKLNESMEIYYQLLAECYAHKRWVLYFFSQINLYYLRQTIILLNKELSSVKGHFLLGKSTKIWDDDEIYDMQLSHMLTDIPAEIRRYSFLHKLTEKNYYKDDFVRFYNDNYEIEKNISKRMYTVAGWSKDQISKIRIIDAINFIYGNRITFDKFSEHKNFVKISLQKRFKGMLSQNELGKQSKSMLYKSNYIDFYEVLLLIRCFSYDDLYVFYDIENGNELMLQNDSVTEFEKYISNLMEYFKENYIKGMEGDVIIEYLTLKDEIKNALYIASFYVQTDKVVFNCVQYLFEALPYTEIGLDKRMPMIKRFIEHMSDSNRIRMLIEDDIVQRIERCNKGHEKVIDFEKTDISMEIHAINEWFNGYKSKKIKQSISKSREIVSNALKPLLEGIV